MILKPLRVEKNSKVALIAPSGRLSKDQIEKSIDNIISLGLKAETEQTTENYGYFAQTDNKRLDELESAFIDKNIMSVFCIRGGYGATRLLSKINYDLIKKNSKVFVGFSDITALQSAFFEKEGLVSIHGLIASSDFTDYVKKQLKDLIFEPKKNYILPAKSFKVLNQGQAKGRIVGGNLSLLDSLIGTEYLFKFKNRIVFIEEVAEPPYKIDRMLNHLLMATDLREAVALVFGQFSKCTPNDFNMTQKESFLVEELISQYFSHWKIPIIFNLNFGHIKNGLLFPIGVQASLDTLKKEIQLLEKAVL